MRVKSLIGLTTLANAFGAVFLVSSAQASGGGGSGCPSAWAEGTGCTAETAKSQCQTDADAFYGVGCTVLCAHCSSGGDYNCEFIESQC
jgi:hypothetical protein